MEQTIVRITALKLTNIKNTRNGVIKMPIGNRDNETAEILGIYGQNGSGKTAAIDALYIVQTVMMGLRIPDEFVNFITVGEETGRISLDFLIKTETCRYEAAYLLILRRTEKKGVEILRETLSCSRIMEGKRSRSQPFVDYGREDENRIFSPKSRLDQVAAGNKQNRTILAAAKKVAEINNCSYIFGETSRFILCERAGGDFAPYSYLIKALHRYARMDLFVIQNSHSGAISAEIYLPMAFKVSDDGALAKGDFVVTLREPTLILEERFDILKKIIDEINVVIQTIIPGLTLGIHDYGSVIREQGKMARKVDLISIRDGKEIPIRYESEGIIKIISILNALIRAYNHPGICLAVDELDAGIYEYLLGELLDIFNKGGKGQIIFTSHNLRPLEMLRPESILFSTANPDNRYIRIQNIRSTNNLRDVYLRSITLGGQKECIYSETDSLRIARAFRKAGKEMGDFE